MDGTTAQVDHVENVIRDLYDGVLDHVLWQQAIARLCALTGSGRILAILRELGRPDVQLADLAHPGPGMVLTASAGGAVAQLAAGPVRLIGVNDPALDPEIRGLMHRCGAACLLCLPLGSDSTPACLFVGATAHRTAHLTTLAPLLAQLSVHMRRAILLRWRYHRLAEQAHLGLFLLDHYQMPVMVVDCDGRILLQNSCAEAWHSGLPRLVAERLNRQTCTVAKKICKRAHATAVTGMQVDGTSGMAPLYLTGLPLASEHPLARHWAMQVGVIIVQQAHGMSAAWRELLRGLFGLSPAEVRLLEQLVEHDSLVHAAESLGVSQATARTQLKAIFHKTGVNKQAALSRLISQVSQFH
jgi:DNA-binding CsgD family transcriptional regulator